MGYVAPRTRQLRAARRFRRDERRLPPGKDIPPSPPTFWLWFDHFLTKEQKDGLNYAVNGPALQEYYRYLCATAWKPFADKIKQMVAQ